MRTDPDQLAVAVRARKAPAAHDHRTGAFGLLGQPADDVGGAGCQEIAARCEQIDRIEVGRIEADTVNAPHQFMGQVDFVGGLLHEDAGCVNAHTRVGFGLQHAHFEAAHGRGAGAQKPGKTCADNDDVEQGLIAIAHAHGRSPDSLVFRHIGPGVVDFDLNLAKGLKLKSFYWRRRRDRACLTPRAPQFFRVPGLHGSTSPDCAACAGSRT